MKTAKAVLEYAGMFLLIFVAYGVLPAIAITAGCTSCN